MQHTLILKPTMNDTERLQPFIALAAETAGIGGKEAKQLRLAVEEAVANVINYGRATAITLRTEEGEDRLVMTIDDDGIPFDPTQGSPTDLTVPASQRPPGGLGIIMMQRMTDAMSYQRSDGHNILRMEKKKATSPKKRIRRHSLPLFKNNELKLDSRAFLRLKKTTNLTN